MNLSRFAVTIIFNFVLFFGLIAQITINPYLPDPNPAPVKSGLKLIWSDEFNTTGAVNPSFWNFESGFVRNEELQWYQSGNASCKDGVLRIEGRRDTIINPRYVAGSTDWRTNRKYAYYSSSCIKTNGKFSFQYGKIEVRAKIPTGKGAWPAIWTLGNSYDWPSCGEVDMMEYYISAGIPSVLANLAWGTATAWTARWNSSVKPLSYFVSKDAEWINKFHVWRMDWDKDYIKLYLDDELLNSQALSSSLNANATNGFWQPHYVLLNLAIGGNGGDPSATIFPMVYQVDYVRVYQTEKVQTLNGNNVALGKPVKVESEYNSTYTANKLTDGDSISTSSRWLNSGNTLPTWAEIDLLKEYEIEGINLFEGITVPSNQLNAFSFQYFDGATWQNILTETDDYSATYVRRFTPVKTSKVRLFISEPRDGKLARIFEVMVFEKGSISSSPLVFDNKITVSPNPATNYININPESTNDSFSLVDCTGKKIMTLSNGGSFFVGNLARGLYLLHSKGKYPTKLILQ